MFQEAFKKLELDEVATILDKVNPAVEGSGFDPVTASVMAMELPFYPGYRLLEISDQSVSPPVMRVAVYSDQDFQVLDWSNEPVYALNAKVPIKLDEMNVCEYAIFFFTYVCGRHGRFLIVQNVDDIAWSEDPPATARKAIGDMLIPVTIKEKAENGTFQLEARMIFKDSLFKSDIYVHPDGHVVLADEELLIEDMPVLDDTFGQ